MGVKQEIYITPSEVIEYLYCPRFIFFMNCLCIPQYEEKRYKVLKGRELHKEKQRINRNYLRKKISCVKKDILVYLSSSRYYLKGEVDEVLHLADGTLAPLDYKFAEYKDTIYRTHKIQSVLYGLLIKDNYQCEVKRGYVCYIRSKYLLKEIIFKDSDFQKAQEIIKDMLRIIQEGYYPKKTKFSVRCIDCCYKNICV
ncbi:MAG: CRISPR-associated protein Cas4 [Spirochaetes bacterium]|nr:MAG: CRISPR-associated protein Cas4 [Spirochaetota bacterium]